MQGVLRSVQQRKPAAAAQGFGRTGSAYAQFHDGNTGQILPLIGPLAVQLHPLYRPDPWAQGQRHGNSDLVVSIFHGCKLQPLNTENRYETDGSIYRTKFCDFPMKINALGRFKRLSGRAKKGSKK
jgi:hypothetical protein